MPSASRPTRLNAPDALSLPMMSKRRVSSATGDLPVSFGQRGEDMLADLRCRLLARIGDEPRLHAAGLAVHPVPAAPRPPGIHGMVDEAGIQQPHLAAVLPRLRTDRDTRV